MCTKPTCIMWIGALVAALHLAPPVLAVDPSASINAAGVVAFPTAHNQTNDHMIHLSLDVVDIGEPDLRGENLRYGYQWGDLQLLLDIHAFTRPKSDFDFAQLRAKLRVLPLDEIRTTLALGLLGRYTDSDAGQARIDDRNASLFAVVTNQFYLLGSLATMTNLYLDNLFANFGLKMEVYQFIMLVAESDYYHSMPDLPDRSHNRVGIEIDGEQNFYFQLLYEDTNEHALVQFGTGF